MGYHVADTPMRHGKDPRARVGGQYELRLVVQHPLLWLPRLALVIGSS